MGIDVYGPNFGRPYSKSVAQKIKAAIAVMSCKLGIAHVPIKYEILLGRSVNKFDDGCRGWASADKLQGNWCATIFIARVDSFEDMLSTLAHELIHIKQFVKDGLDLDAGVFKGKRWNARKHQSIYYDSPWEREAYNKEVALKDFFLSYLEKNHN